jgi:ArsR family transcriptional regulator, arsenate/arsenite/antimonite-responsive transcriptional repressor
MTVDAYCAPAIDSCQCLAHTGEVSTTTFDLTPVGAAQDACGAPLLREPLTADQAADLARILKALADPTRLRLVSMVAAHQGGEACVCDLTGPLGLTQPTISHHLKVLVEAGILSRDKRGVWAYYALVPGTLRALSAVIGDTGSLTGSLAGSLTGPATGPGAPGDRSA